MSIPIVEVSEPHGRLIDVDKIFNAVRISKDIDDESKAKFMGLLLVEELTIEEIVRIVKQNNIKVIISVNGYEVRVEPIEKPITWNATTIPCNIVAK